MFFSFAGIGKVWLFDMNQRIRVAVADDNARIANLLEYELQKDDEIEFVGKAENGLEILEVIKQKQPAFCFYINCHRR